MKTIAEAETLSITLKTQDGDVKLDLDDEKIAQFIEFASALIASDAMNYVECDSARGMDLMADTQFPCKIAEK